MHNKRIGFIGGGNMAASLVAGLIAGHMKPEQISVSEPDEERRASLAERFGVEVGADNSAVVARSDMVVLAVKPQVIHQVSREIEPLVQDRKPLVMSIAAGIRESSLCSWLGGNVPVVRAMPNTPAMVQCGATALFANAFVSDEQKSLAETVMRSVGLALWLEREKLMDAVTAVSGSGPAYFFLMTEMLQHAGQALGLSAETARLLSLQTAFGAAKMALESSLEPEALRRQVTSPGGTTERAINTLIDGKIRDLFTDAVFAAEKRAGELAEQLGD